MLYERLHDTGRSGVWDRSSNTITSPKRRSPPPLNLYDVNPNCEEVFVVSDCKGIKKRYQLHIKTGLFRPSPLFGGESFSPLVVTIPFHFPSPGPWTTVQLKSIAKYMEMRSKCHYNLPEDEALTRSVVLDRLRQVELSCPTIQALHCWSVRQELAFLTRSVWRESSCSSLRSQKVMLYTA